MSKKKNHSKKNRSDLIFGISVTIGAVIILVSFYLFKDQLKPKLNQESVPEIANVNIKNEPFIGDKDAPVTIVEYGDYKCPACGIFSNHIFTQIQADYIDNGQVKLVFKNYPFIFEDSTRTAVYGEGVYDVLGNDAFWKFHKTIFAYQNEIYGENLDQEMIQENEHKNIFTEKQLNYVAKELFGKNEAKKLNNILKEKEYKNEVSDDIKEAKSDKISSTPTIFINGEMSKEPLNYEALKASIDEALANKDQ